MILGGSTSFAIYESWLVQRDKTVSPFSPAKTPVDSEEILLFHRSSCCSVDNQIKLPLLNELKLFVFNWSI